MPLITINITEGMTDFAIDQLQDTIHTCFVKAWNIPENGGFYVINEFYTVYGERKDIDKINLEIDA